jgi:AraC-like DNA-binding protein
VAGMPDPPISLAGRAHALAMLACIGAAIWQVVRGWRDDLVEPRRDLRRWAGIGIGLYGALALVVELAVRGLDIGLLLPALHVAGIGLVALALALLIARRSLAVVLGLQEAPAPAAVPTAPPEPAVPTAALPSPARRRLEQAMAEPALYRREGLTLAALAQELQTGEDSLRRLINHELGFRNFNDFLHHHRLAEAAPRLAAEQLPILSIALECGYGSIGPFNRAFRQRFGMTPSEYRAAARMKRLDAAPPGD